MSSRSTADLLYLIGFMVLSIGLGLLELLVALDISKAFDRVSHAGLLQNLNSCEGVGLSFSVIGGFR